MANRVLFIDINYLKESTPIDDNVDAKLLTPFITKAQELHIHKDLGSRLYDQLKTLVISGDITLSGNTVYKTLLDDFIRPSEAEWTLFEALPFINFKLTNKAVSKRSSEESAPSEIDEVRWLRDSVNISAEFYSDRTIQFLKENKTDYQELCEPLDCDDIRPSTTGFFGGIYMPKK